jgi:hypothetical protein
MDDHGDVVVEVVEIYAPDKGRPFKRPKVGQIKTMD